VNSVCFNAHTGAALVEHIPPVAAAPKKRKAEEVGDGHHERRFIIWKWTWTIINNMDMDYYMEMDYYYIIWFITFIFLLYPHICFMVYYCMDYYNGTHNMNYNIIN